MASQFVLSRMLLMPQHIICTVIVFAISFDRLSSNRCRHSYSFQGWKWDSAERYAIAALPWPIGNHTATSFLNNTTGLPVCCRANTGHNKAQCTPELII